MGQASRTAFLRSMSVASMSSKEIGACTSAAATPAMLVWTQIRQVSSSSQILEALADLVVANLAPYANSAARTSSSVVSSAMSESSLRSWVKIIISAAATILNIMVLKIGWRGAELVQNFLDQNTVINLQA
jgi:hypothetical protein